MNQLGKPHGALGVSDYDGIISPAYFVARIGPAAEPRFIHHLLRTRLYISEYERRGKFMPPSQFDISWDQFRSIEVLLPPLHEQRGIADYLDAETARIDALTTKKRRLIELLDEHAVAESDEYLRADVEVPLHRIADLLAGFTFPSDGFSPEFLGPRLLRGVNVGVGEVPWEDTVRLGDDGAQLGRYRLRVGDLVLGMDRPFIGRGTRVAAIDEDDDGALLVQRVCRIRTAPAMATVVRHALLAPRFMAHVEPDLTGVSVPHLSESQIGSFPVPWLTPTEYATRAAALAAIERLNKAVVEPLRHQIDLLVERRQSLITAAVTGELAVPGVAA